MATNTFKPGGNRRIYKQPNGKAWTIKWKDGDGIWRAKAVSRSYAVAERILREYEHESDLVRAGVAKRGNNRVDLRALLEDFRASLESDGRRKATLDSYRLGVERILDHTGATLVSDLTPDKVDAFKAGAARQKDGKPLSTSSVSSSIGSLQTLLRWAVRHERIADSPIRHATRPQVIRVHERRPLEDDEIERLLEASPPWYRRIWATFILTGLRRNELVELRWKDVDLDGDQAVLTVRAETCKTKREDFLPISPTLEEVLREVRNERAKQMGKQPGRDDHVFLTGAGTPWKNNLLRRFRKCLEEAGIDQKGLDLHSLRQTFGTRLAANPENDVKTVQTLMRHKTIAMTMQLYVKARVVRLRGAVDTMGLPGARIPKQKKSSGIQSVYRKRRRRKAVTG